MARSIKNLNPGDVVMLKFHGSKQYGNEPHELKFTFSHHGTHEDGSTPVAHFGQGEGGLLMTAQFLNGRWRYGTSNEVVSIVD